MAYKLIDCGDHRKRRSFSRIRNTYALGDLLEIQKKSYNWFMEEGIEEVFKDLFPVENFAGTLSLEFGDYHFDEPRYSIKECKERYATYASVQGIGTKQEYTSAYVKGATSNSLTTANTKYTVSFWAKGTCSIICYFYPLSLLQSIYV